MGTDECFGGQVLAIEDAKFSPEEVEAEGGLYLFSSGIITIIFIISILIISIIILTIILCIIM